MVRFVPLLLVMGMVAVVVDEAQAINLLTLPPTDGQGWRLIMNRVNNSEKFYRNWNDYKNGFGHPNIHDEGNFYIGNERFHRITTKPGSTYRFRAEAQFKLSGQWNSVEFSNVKVDSEENQYTIYLSGEVGPQQSCLNASGAPLISIKFSTYDRDNDNLTDKNCASEYKGGWWFDNCNCACLTCEYDDKGLYWYRNGTLVAELSAIKMKIKQNDD